MTQSPLTSNRDPYRDQYYVELMQFSSRALRKKLQQRSPRSRQESLHLSALNWQIDALPATRPAPTPAPSSPDRLKDEFPQLVESHADPLMPLRERDLTALVGLFETADMDLIQADVIDSLKQRSPEPCWEDDPFDFLRDYL